MQFYKSFVAMRGYVDLYQIIKNLYQSQLSKLKEEIRLSHILKKKRVGLHIFQNWDVSQVFFIFIYYIY